MDNLLLSIKVVLPLCIYMGLGYGLKRWLRLSDQMLSELNTLIFKVFLPIMLFRNVYQSDLSSAFNLNLLIYVVLAIVIFFTLLCIIIPKIEKDNPKSSVMIQGIYRSNYVIFGIPVTAAVYGADHLGMSALIAAVAVPIFNILAVLVFEMFREGNLDAKSLFRGIATNPLVLSSVVGGLFLILHIKIPTLIMNIVNDTGNIASPLALIVLGATFQFKSLSKYKKQLTITVLGKLVIMPAIFLSIGIALGFKQQNIVILMTLFAAPTAVSSYTMADQMGGNAELAGQVVVLASITSILTIFTWTYLLTTLNLV